MQASAYAFFDVDDTILRTKSMFSFFEYWCKTWLNDLEILSRFDDHFQRARLDGSSREIMNRDYYRFYSGIECKKLESAGKSWAASIIANNNFYDETLDAMKKLAERGVFPVLVSGSFDAVLRPIANHLSVTHILSAQLETRPDGRYSGDIADPQTIGVGKAVAIQQFLTQHDAAAAGCWAFGDDVSDVPMLESVGHPVAVGSNSELLKIARDRRWETLSLMEY